MITLTPKQEERFRVTLFKTRYKALTNEGLSNDERFERAISETSDDAIKLEEYPVIVERWLNEFYLPKAAKLRKARKRK